MPIIVLGRLTNENEPIIFPGRFSAIELMTATINGYPIVILVVVVESVVKLVGVRISKH